MLMACKALKVIRGGRAIKGIRVGKVWNRQGLKVLRGHLAFKAIRVVRE